LSARAFTFGQFRLLPEERRLLEAGRPVRISSRALDILTVLVDHAGELVGKDQLITHAWPNTRVEEKQPARAHRRASQGASIRANTRLTHGLMMARAIPPA